MGTDPKPESKGQHSQSYELGHDALRRNHFYYKHNVVCRPSEQISAASHQRGTALKR